MNDHQEFADAFDRDLDPLAEYAPTFQRLDSDPFETFIRDVLESDGLKESTIDDYRRDFREWREFMSGEGRHPACPSEEHARGFIRWELDEKGNAPASVKNRLGRINRAFRWFGQQASLPHPTDYNPVETAREKVDWGTQTEKEWPEVSVEELADVLADVTHLRERAIIMLQLKLGLRATEVCNIQLQDVHIDHDDLLAAYPNMATADRLDGHENVLYVPHDREGNKSERPRILPLDDELCRVLTRYLLVRPDVDRPWLLLSTGYGQLDKDAINRAWTDAFHPEHAETDRTKGITSHFGRHFITSYLKNEGMTREKVQYLRGDKIGSKSLEEKGAIDDYLHVHYSDIAEPYREKIFKLEV